MMKDSWLRLPTFLLLILTIEFVAAIPAHTLEWVKTLDGGSNLVITRETCDTIQIVDTIYSDPEMPITLTEEWNPVELALLDYSMTGGAVLTGSGSLEWTVTATAGGVTITKWFHVEQSTWPQSILQETLTPAEGSPLTKPVTVNKYLPVLWIDTFYSPFVIAGGYAIFTIRYGNNGGYENDVMIRSEFPPQALFSSANPAPDREDPSGTWAEWDAGDLMEGAQGTIQVTVAIAAGLSPSTKIDILSEIYNHVDELVDTAVTTFEIPTPIPAFSNWGLVAFGILIFISVIWLHFRRRKEDERNLL